MSKASGLHGVLGSGLAQGAASAAATPWYRAGGAPMPVAAYAPKGAASLAASYSNLANPGTYDAAPGVAPTWDAVNGWTFAAASGQFLTTGIVPVRGAGTLIARFSDAVSNGLGPIVAGVFESATCVLGVGGYYWANQIYSSNGADSADAPGMAAGVLCMAGVSLYRNGVYDSDKGAGSGSFTKALRIGHMDTGYTWDHFEGKVQAVAYYADVLAAGEVAAVSAAMAAL